MALNEGHDLTLGVFVAPPRKDADDLQLRQRSLLQVHVLDNSGSPTLDEQRLLAFLAQVRQDTPE